VRQLMRLCLSDPSYTDRLATFLRSLGQTVLVAAPDQLEVDAPTSSSVDEIGIYLRVWKVLYPDAEVFQFENGEELAAT
jgi:hypothetical protein